jgi:hypothetical protein
MRQINVTREISGKLLDSAWRRRIFIVKIDGFYWKEKANEPA